MPKETIKFTKKKPIAENNFLIKTNSFLVPKTEQNKLKNFNINYETLLDEAKNTCNL